MCRILEAYEQRDDDFRANSRKAYASVGRCSHAVNIIEGFTDLKFMARMDVRGVSFVVRQKRNTLMDVLQARAHKNPRVIADETVVPSRARSAALYPGPLRRVTAVPS